MLYIADSYTRSLSIRAKTAQPSAHTPSPTTCKQEVASTMTGGHTGSFRTGAVDEGYELNI